MSWQDRFEALASFLDARCGGAEVYTLNLSTETSDFVRFNQGKVRQAGTVSQAVAELRWVLGRRHASASVVLTGERGEDERRLGEQVEALRALVPLLPEDPHLLLSEQPTSSSRVSTAPATEVGEVIDSVCGSASSPEPVDLVGIYAGGTIGRGFASRYGHRHWSGQRNVLFDWSLVHSADKAVKSTWSGPCWDEAAYGERMAAARQQLTALRRPSHVLKPGAYRAMLSSAAVGEVLELFAWGDFGARAVQSKASAFQRLIAGSAALDARVRISEHTAGGVAPAFQEAGFVRPDEVVLIEGGAWVGPLISPRSAVEQGVPTNGASGSEAPQSLLMRGGALASSEALKALGTGLWVSNLWYLNHSDRSAGRFTGMTRFATFWVEDGELVAPLSVMRFDESIYALLGHKLEALTHEVDLLPSASTYGGRSTSSMRLPGLLVRDLTFTL
jgi:predicted Zn-dependent protease